MEARDQMMANLNENEFLGNQNFHRNRMSNTKSYIKQSKNFYFINFFLIL